MSTPNDTSANIRSPSIAERASAAMEAGLGEIESRLSTISRRKSLNVSSKDLIVEEQYSMVPDDYELIQPIGQGSSALVYLANYKVLKKPVSIKVIDLDMFERNQIDELRRELQTMVLSRHPNLLPVYGSFVNGSKLFIVTPFLSAGSVLDIMKSAFKNGMEEIAIATILKQVLQGLEYLHSHGLIHRDIKAGNLLVNEDGLVQVADFGVSSSLTDHGSRNGSRKTFVGTPCWMAPEVMDQSGYNYKADIWSFGITALELANGQAPYAKFPPMKVLMLTLQNSPPTLDRDKTLHKYTRQFKDMIDSCLQKDPAKRPTAEKLLAHPFFKCAKKPSYLVSTILNGLTPVVNRPLRTVEQVTEEDTPDNDEGWDFDEGSVRQKGSSAIKSVELPMVAKPSSVRFNNTAELISSSQNTSEMKEPVKNAEMQASMDGAKEETSGPKKSRFVVNDGGEKDSSIPPEVRKGRFSVIEPMVITNSNTVTSISHVNSAHTSSNQSSPSLQPTEYLVTTSSEKSLERKAGRFEVQDLPNINLQVIEGKEPLKTPRKFTFVESPSIVQASPQSNNSVPPASKDKRGRFEIIDSSDSVLENSLMMKLLEEPSANLSDAELLVFLSKQNRLQKAIMQEMSIMLEKQGIVLDLKQIISQTINPKVQPSQEKNEK